MNYLNIIFLYNISLPVSMDKDSVFLKSGAFSFLTVTAFSFLAVARILLIFSDLLKPRAPLWRHALSWYRWLSDTYAPRIIRVRVLHGPAAVWYTWHFQGRKAKATENALFAVKCFTLTVSTLRNHWWDFYPTNTSTITWIPTSYILRPFWSELSF